MTFKPIQSIAADVLTELADKLPPEEHEKRECLARWVLELRTKADRIEWLAKFEQRNGKAITDDLKARMTRIYRQRVEERRASHAR